MPGTGAVGKLFFKGFWESEVAVAEKQTDETNTVEKQRLPSQAASEAPSRQENNPARAAATAHRFRRAPVG